MPCPGPGPCECKWEGGETASAESDSTLAALAGRSLSLSRIPLKLESRWCLSPSSRSWLPRCPTVVPMPWPTVPATLATPLSVLLRNSRPRPSPRGAQVESHADARSAASSNGLGEAAGVADAGGPDARESEGDGEAPEGMGGRVEVVGMEPDEPRGSEEDEELRRCVCARKGKLPPPTLPTTPLGVLPGTPGAEGERPPCENEEGE